MGDWCFFGVPLRGIGGWSFIDNRRSKAPLYLIVFYHPNLARILAEVKRLGGEIGREIFDFPGRHRFHFRAPGGGEFAIWSDK